MRLPAGLHGGHAQCWSWDFDPDDGWVYVASTGFQRDKGVILRRVRPEHLADPARYVGWGHQRAVGVGPEPIPITPPGETWGELTLRRMATGSWVLGGFESSAYALGYRAVEALTADLHRVPCSARSWAAPGTPRTTPAAGWRNSTAVTCCRAALGVPGGVGLMVSQWNTAHGWPYRVMQFRVTLQGP